LFLAGGGAFLLTAAIGTFLVPYLRRVKAGQSIREDGPKWHKKKQGTPTLGGIMFIAAIAITGLALTWPMMLDGDFTFLFVFVFALVFAVIGFIDDYEKLKKKQNLGLTSKQKFLLQLVIAIVFVLLLRLFGITTPNLYIPFVNVSIPLPEPLYLVFAAFVIVAEVNGANLTDGADGLASGVTLPIAVACAAISLLAGGLTGAGIFSAALAGGLLGFLLFNFHPAKVFMGDTGAQFLGGAVAALAFVLDMPVVLILLGIIYFLEALSDVIQVAYFKLTHGKRFFKMAPLHHHFELSGWNEYKLFFAFTGVSAVFCAIAYFAVRLRYSI
jgi:phospho-N-acetylmuramoyl-pentapeptide-transferase